MEIIIADKYSKEEADKIFDHMIDVIGARSSLHHAINSDTQYINQIEVMIAHILWRYHGNGDEIWT